MVFAFDAMPILLLLCRESYPLVVIWVSLYVSSLMGGGGGKGVGGENG